jgi:hypothetical protein
MALYSRRSDRRGIFPCAQWHLNEWAPLLGAAKYVSLSSHRMEARCHDGRRASDRSPETASQAKGLPTAGWKSRYPNVGCSPTYWAKPLQNYEGGTIPLPNAGKESVEHPATSHEYGDEERADGKPDLAALHQSKIQDGPRREPFFPK